MAGAQLARTLELSKTTYRKRDWKWDRHADETWSSQRSSNWALSKSGVDDQLAGHDLEPVLLGKAVQHLEQCRFWHRCAGSELCQQLGVRLQRMARFGIRRIVFGHHICPLWANEPGTALLLTHRHLL